MTITLKSFEIDNTYVNLRAQDMLSGTNYIVGFYEYNRKVKELIYADRAKAERSFDRQCKKIRRA